MNCKPTFAYPVWIRIVRWEEILFMAVGTNEVWHLVPHSIMLIIFTIQRGTEE